MAKITKCKRCGEENLTWSETEHGWRLFNAAGDRHNCPNRPKGGGKKKSAPDPMVRQLAEAVADLVTRVEDLEKKLAKSEKSPQGDLFE